MRDTWDLIDAKLGAYVRGQAVLIVLVGTVLSVAFWAIGLPYWLLVGAFAGLVEFDPGDRPARRRRARGRGRPDRLLADGRSQPGSPCSSSGCSRTTS